MFLSSLSKIIRSGRDAVFGVSVTPTMVALCVVIALICSWFILGDTTDWFSGSILEGNTGSPWLCDYYVKSAYNACAESYEQNAIISTTQLNKVIREGYRCVDFELHPMDGEPVIAATASDVTTRYDSANHISFSSAMKIIKDFAFVSGMVAGDAYSPLFINLRLKIFAPEILDMVAEIIKKAVGRHLLRGTHNPHAVSFEGIQTKKVVIMVDATDQKVMESLEKSALKEYANIIWGTGTLRALQYGDLMTISNPEIYEKETRNQFTIIYPGTTRKNPNSELPISYGCQFITMRVGVEDSYLSNYESFFKNHENSTRARSFVLKPETPKNMRHDPGHEVAIPSGPKVEKERRVISTGTKAISNVGSEFKKM